MDRRGRIELENDITHQMQPGKTSTKARRHIRSRGVHTFTNKENVYHVSRLNSVPRVPLAITDLRSETHSHPSGLSS